MRFTFPLVIFSRQLLISSARSSLFPSPLFCMGVLKSPLAFTPPLSGKSLPPPLLLFFDIPRQPHGATSYPSVPPATLRRLFPPFYNSQRPLWNLFTNGSASIAHRRQSSHDLIFLTLQRSSPLPHFFSPLFYTLAFLPLRRDSRVLSLQRVPPSLLFPAFPLEKPIIACLCPCPFCQPLFPSALGHSINHSFAVFFLDATV